MIYSPLRYPGGKNKLSAFIAEICKSNGITGHYVEPYSGGASVALFLLLENYIEKVTINDKDRSVYALWHSILNNKNKLVKKIRETEINVENWRNQKEVQNNKDKADLLDLGFSTLFLNRTNRSGILTGGIIGGVKQDGDYLMNCRFNKEEIISRIERISKEKKRIKLHKKDALSLINHISEKEGNLSNTLFYFDPPYFLKASSLYMNYYKKEDHKLVGQSIRNTDGLQYVVSYDNHPSINSIYKGLPYKEYSFNHSAFEAREGKEIVFFSPELIVPDLDKRNPIYFKKKKNSNEIIYKLPHKKVY